MQTPAILVVETETTSRSSLSELLREQGYLVAEAGDSGAAIDALQDSDIKVILADLEMPSWSSIIQHAAANLPETFILGMLRYGALANAREAQRLGAHGYFIKPLDFADVNQWIRRYLTDQSSIKI